MESPSIETDRVRDAHSVAVDKVRLWEKRAVTAREQGRVADANRCDDKARDWASRARLLERQQRSNKGVAKG